MSIAINDVDNQNAIKLTQQAHNAELTGNYKQAYDLQLQVSSLLAKAVANGKKKSEERRRAKLQYRAAQERRFALQACVQGMSKPPEPLPTSNTIQREITNPVPGTVLLTLVEMGLLAVPGEATEVQQPQQPQEASKPLLLTPMLSPSLPDVTYHVYVEKISRYPKMWIYFHIKNAEKNQTLYTLAAVKHRRYQIPSCTLARASEYHNICAAITVTPIRPRQSASECCAIGRPLTILTGTQKAIVDAPDRLERDWFPRRFTYGGRRFVWKIGKGLLNTVDTLYEVGKEWPDPNSKTGKVLDEIHPRPLVWGESKIAMNKVCTIHMVGGLDQMFREFVLASQVTRRLISLYGHS